MRTITIEIINEKALKLLLDLVLLELIRLHKPESKSGTAWLNYKGAMSKQSTGDIDQQLNDLRNEWE